MWHTEIAATENVKKCILSCAVTGYFNILLKLIWLIVNYICSFILYITELPFFAKNHLPSRSEQAANWKEIDDFPVLCWIR